MSRIVESAASPQTANGGGFTSFTYEGGDSASKGPAVVSLSAAGIAFFSAEPDIDKRSPLSQKMVSSPHYEVKILREPEP